MPLTSEPILAGGWVIGYVTSGTIGCRTGKTLVLGYVERGASAMGANCAVSIQVETFPALRHSPHQYDPENDRMKG